MEQVNWGIIGCGDVTEVKSGPAFNKISHSKLVAVMRRDKAKAADYALRHGVEKWYSNAQELIENPEVNAVYVATPPSTHFEYTMAALKAGKPVYVEKPMALTMAEAQQMDGFAAEQGVKLCVAHYRRELPLFRKVRSLLGEQAIGEVRLAQLQLFQSKKARLIASSEENWRVDPLISGGGLFYDLAPHQLDLMLHLFGSVKWSCGLAAGLSNDIVSGVITFDNDILFNGTWGFNMAEADTADSCIIYGSKGSLHFGFFGQTLGVNMGGVATTLEFDTPQHVQQPMIEKVVAYFLGNGENPCDGNAGVATLQLMEQFTKGQKLI